MIYVVDNGESYDDHGFYFYNLPDDLPVEEGRWLLENVPGCYSSYEVILVAKECPFVGSIPAEKTIVSWIALEGANLDGEWMKRCPKNLLLAVIDVGLKEVEGWEQKYFALRRQEHLDKLSALRAWVEAR